MASVPQSSFLPTNKQQQPEIPDEEYVPYSNAITDLLSDPSKKLIVLLVGVSGSGKTFLRNRLLSHIPSSLNVTPRTFCLDDYREKHNNGVYPIGDAQHKAVNKKIFPIFNGDVTRARDRLIFFDNMHLKWSPDWETAVNKALNEDYYVLPMTPALKEAMFCTNNSEHGVDDKLFFTLAASWGGHKFGPFLYHLIAPQALKGMKPLKRDTFHKVKLFPWQRGWLYVQDQYLGYIDKEMVYAVMAAGHEMRRGGVEEYFMRKDGNIHITLIDPGRFQESDLQKLAQTIVRMYPDGAPQTVYTGVGTLEDPVADTQTYFLTVDEKSQMEWEDVISKASEKTFGKAAEFQPDGVHVTIGFKNRDIWRRSKRIAPIFPFQDPASATTPHAFLPRYRGLLETAELPIQNDKEGSPGLDPLPEPVDVGSIFQQQLRKWLKGRPVSITAVPKPQLAILDYLVQHQNVNAKFRECPDGYYLIGFSVHSGRRYLSDDDAYKRNPRLQALVPRGLYHGLKLDKDGTVHWLGAVYPTSKFFGDNDTEEGVDLVDEEELQKETGGAGVKFILTEKANGEMFTFSVLDKIPSHNGDKYIVVCGSKNNKFLFQIILSGPQKTEPKQLVQMLVDYLPASEQKQFPSQYKESRNWTYTRVWLEMSDVFLARLLENSNAVWFCDMLYKTKQTACAEFESYLHPHIIAFKDGHQQHRIFALTSYREDGTPKQTEDTVRLKQLLELREKGFGTVEINDTSSTDVMQIRRDVWHRTNSEGVVLLVVNNGKIEKMIKMKTIWYVVHRGFRENLRRHVTSKTDECLRLSTIRPGLQKKLREKLAIFGLKKDESGYWDDYLESLAEFVVEEQGRMGKEAFAEMFTYDYPKIIAGAEEVMERHPKRKGKDEMGMYDIAATPPKRSPSPLRRTPSPTSGRSPKRAK